MWYIEDSRNPGERLGGYFFTEDAAKKAISRTKINLRKTTLAKEQIEFLTAVESVQADSVDRPRSA